MMKPSEETRRAIENAERTYAETRARQAGQVQPKLDRIIQLSESSVKTTVPLMPREAEEIRGLALDLKLLMQDYEPGWTTSELPYVRRHR